MIPKRFGRLHGGFHGGLHGAHLRFLALTVGLVLLGVPLRAVSDEDAPRVWREAYLMGTQATLVVATPNRPAGLQQLERMLRILEDTERELSTWRDESLLSQLNRHPVADPWQAPPQLCRLFGLIAWWQQETGGAFDPAIGALMDRWQGGHADPSNRAVRSATAAGFDHLTFERDSCTVTRLGNVTLDAGGFGKGEAIDRVTRQLGDASAAPWMIDFGGQVSVSGVPVTGSWSVAVAHPFDRARTVLELQLRNGSIAVSGGSERDRWVEGVRVGHIFDPRSGLPVTRTGSVVVWHREALAADVLSTALYVMGEEAGLAWAEARGVAVCFVSAMSGALSDVTLRASRAFHRQFVLP